MAEPDSPADRKRGQEEDYFRKQERELIERLRVDARAQAERRALAEAAGIADEKSLDDLRKLGYTSETIPLLHLVPLVQVAWAEGSVSRRERDLILEAARLRGIASGSEAGAKLQEWLDQRPSDEFFHRTLAVTGAILEALPAESRQEKTRDLLSYCSRIAEASGGILGIGQVSAAERAALEKIAGQLANAHQSAARKVVEQE